MPAYASALLWHENLDQLRQETARHLDDRFTPVKMRLGGAATTTSPGSWPCMKRSAHRGQVIVDGSLRFSDEDAAWLAETLTRTAPCGSRNRSSPVTCTATRR